jgi:hypothetical protein
MRHMTTHAASEQSSSGAQVYAIIVGMAALVVGLICLSRVLESVARDIECKSAPNPTVCVQERSQSRSGLQMVTEVLVGAGLLVAMGGVATLRSKPSAH